MNTLDLGLNLSLLALMVLSQLGERPLDRWTYLWPALITAAVAYFFLGGIPTQGNDVGLYAAALVAGALFGLLALALIEVHWNADQGWVVARAG